VVPSGGARLTSCCATAPAPWVLFSMVIVWPSRSLIFSPSRRLTMSGLPPAAVPTMMRK
jgi:hypothetical protein